MHFAWEMTLTADKWINPLEYLLLPTLNRWSWIGIVKSLSLWLAVLYYSIWITMMPALWRIHAPDTSTDPFVIVLVKEGWVDMGCLLIPGNIWSNKYYSHSSIYLLDAACEFDFNFAKGEIGLATCIQTLQFRQLLVFEGTFALSAGGMVLVISKIFRVNLSTTFRV